MKLAVLNGSPKGQTSVTMQYIAFIQKRFPEHELQILNIAHEINKIEGDDQVFQSVINEIKSADGIIWAFPLYIGLVAAQYKRFIELIFERNAQTAFINKYAAILTTSIHFFDHLAHNYLNAICDDLEMKYVGCFSAEMDDLLNHDSQRKLISFATHFFNAISNQIQTTKNFAPVVKSQFAYNPGKVNRVITPGDKKIVILTDVTDNEMNLNSMIERAKDIYGNQVEVFNLRHINIRGGCLGCLRCGYNYTCAYTGKDEFIDFYNSKLKTADILIFAGGIKDRYLSSRWKFFFDRGFFNSHTPSFPGKQIGFLITGPLRQIPNLRQILEGYVQWQWANLAGIVTDEDEDSRTIDSLLDNFARNIVEYAKDNYIAPPNFLGVGGLKIFRDDIWGKLRFVWQADHRFYKKNRVYDFPQKNYLSRVSNALIILLMKIPMIRNEFYKRVKSEMIKPYQKAL